MFLTFLFPALAHGDSIPAPTCYVESQCLKSMGDCIVSAGTTDEDYDDQGHALHVVHFPVFFSMQRQQNNVCVAYNGTVARFTAMNVDSVETEGLGRNLNLEKATKQADANARAACQDLQTSAEKLYGRCPN